MNPIKTFGLFANTSEKSQELVGFIRSRLIQEGFEESECPELAIAIGGDGSFLHMIRENHFETNRRYIGINTGTLGFLQDIKVEEFDQFVEYLKAGDYHYELCDIQKTTVHTASQDYEYLALNETVVRRSDLNAINMKVMIGEHVLEHFAGDGILVATSVGSTAYNMSFQGSIVDPSLKTMQITPIAPLTNKRYHNLMSSVVVPDYKKISLKMEKTNIMLTVDGDNHPIDDVTSIDIAVTNDKLLRLCFHKYDFASKIHKKLLIDD